MRSIICPKCGYEISTGVDGYPMIVWGVCPVCGAKFTSEGELDTQIGWVQIGCWVPPKEETNKREEKKSKSLEEQVLDYFKSKGTVPNYSREWLAKQQKLGKTFQELKPRIDALIEDRREWEKRVKSENERRKEDVISEVLDETRIKKQAEAYTAIRIIWENHDKWNNRRELIKAGDRRWNLSTSKYVSANYERLVELTEEAMRRFN